ncbi:hypothetical protein [Chryseobacterium gambrini]|uniref:hypothetical protein n=1 Tax=Chryseobacterium gambrini TaxID=373672 RepID=UPI0022F3BD62|nr:hypothetical protein [Chryseobacterium gambrini]WBX95542.1 hypothetical protein PE065_11710 [Chryseobacterium gambrini]
MRNIYIFYLIGLSCSSFAQVGIHTSSPQASLDIRGKNDTGTLGVAVPGVVDAVDGILVPRVTALNVNGTVNGQLVYLIANSGSFNKGFYYWDGVASWVGLGGSGTAGDLTNDAFINDNTNQMVKLGTQSDGSTARPANKAFVIKDNGNLGIGTETPNISALLDLTASDKGILIPRVALTSSTDIVTIPNPLTSMLVYNNGSAALTYKGFVFWNGTEWRTINNQSTKAPTVTSLICNSATISPGNYTSGTAYSGILKIPYTDGNGGLYQEGTTVTVNGLNIKLLPGELATGSGQLSFSVWGTPTVSSPTVITFPVQGSSGNGLVPFLTNGQNCSASVGDQVAAESSQSITLGPLFSTNDPIAGYHKYITSPDGKFSVRMFVEPDVFIPSIRLQIRSNVGTPHIVWNGSTQRYSGPASVAYNDNVFTAQGIWNGGNGQSFSGPFTADATAAWGLANFYDSSLPEYRTYVWSTLDNAKIVYVLTCFFTNDNNVNYLNPTSCPNGTCPSTKGYLKIEQISSP